MSIHTEEASPDAPTPQTQRSSSRAKRSGGNLFQRIIGVLGELLVTVGVFLLLFVFWQLFVTDWLALRDQSQYIQEITSAWDDPTQKYGTKHTEDPPVIDEPSFGTTFGMMYIPRFGNDYARTITQGVVRETILNVHGIGHYPDTAMPGDIGNFATAGHRTTYGKPYNQVADLVKDDAIIVETKDTWYVYKVTDHTIVTPGHSEVIAPVPNDKTWKEEPTERYITLTSCHPMYSAAERYVVWGKFAYWTPKTEGYPPDLPKEAWEVG